MSPSSRPPQPDRLRLVTTAAGQPAPAARHSSGSGDHRGPAAAPQRDAGWRQAARAARALSWASLVWMTGEGALGLLAADRSGSIALAGWAFGSVIEGLASIVVIWRFTGRRTLSPTSETRARQAVAVSFFLLAPYIAVESIRILIGGRHPDSSTLGLALTSASLLIMPGLGLAKKRLGRRLDSTATAGEGGQNLLCAGQAAAVLAGLALNAAVGWWWADPLIGLSLAAIAVREGLQAWHDDDCC